MYLKSSRLLLCHVYLSDCNERKVVWGFFVVEVFLICFCFVLVRVFLFCFLILNPNK